MQNVCYIKPWGLVRDKHDDVLAGCVSEKLFPVWTEVSLGITHTSCWHKSDVAEDSSGSSGWSRLVFFGFGWIKKRKNKWIKQKGQRSCMDLSALILGLCFLCAVYKWRLVIAVITQKIPTSQVLSPSAVEFWILIGQGSTTAFRKDNRIRNVYYFIIHAAFSTGD